MLWVIGLVCLYGIILICFTILWSSKHSNATGIVEGNLLNCSVIIAFRNEEKVLEKLVQSLRMIDYPQKNIEFHFINDHSTDNSLKLLSDALASFPFKYFIHQLPAPKSGKKQAQLLGVEHASYEIILTTDADCEVPVNWVKEMQADFSDASKHMITGNVTFSGKNFWSKLMRVEFAPLIGFTGVGIYLSNPIMANGANMAFRRTSFFDVLTNRQDIAEVASGDDIFLLEALKLVYGKKSIGFKKTSLVITAPPPNLKSFFHQRLRWASKWKMHRSIKAAVPALLVWLFHLMFFLAVFYLIYSGQWLILFVLLAPKIIAEFLFIKLISADYPFAMNIGAFLLATFFYSFYVIFFGLTANFVKFKWKDRAYG